MIIVDKGIKNEIFNLKNIEIIPFKEEQLNPNSYDLTLNKKCKILHPDALHHTARILLSTKRTDEFKKFISFNDVFEHNTEGYQTLDCKKAHIFFEFDIPEEGLILLPNHLYLFACNEKLGIYGDICANVEGKSSLGRLGLDVHICAGFMDTGFHGSLVLELRTIYPLRIYPDMRIAQIKYERCEEEPETCYKNKEGSKYSGQQGVQESLMYKNFTSESNKGRSSNIFADPPRG